MIFPEIIWMGFIIDLTVILTFLNLIYGTAYIIEEDMQSSPALSLDRIRLKLKNKETVMISPKDRGGFTKEICSINNNINVHI